jgi:hypothetical protein
MYLITAEPAENTEISFFGISVLSDISAVNKDLPIFSANSAFSAVNLKYEMVKVRHLNIGMVKKPKNF